MNKESREQRRLQMYHHIETWQQSSLSQKEYCKSIGEAYCVFHYWLQKYKQENGDSPEGFAEVVMPVPAPLLEIVYPSGITLRLPAGTALQTVRSYINL